MDKAMTLALQKAAMNGLTAVAAPLAAPTLILFTNPGAITKRTLMADLTEATFTGYAAVAGITFGTAYQDDQDQVKISAPSVPFTASGSAIVNAVVGWAITNAAKTTLYYAEKFDEEVAFNEAGDGLMVQPTIPYGA